MMANVGKKALDGILTVADLEKRLRVGPKAIRSAIRAGRLKGIKIGGAFRVSESALARFLEGR
jgi:excisionase family DNA binding protein